EILRLLRAGHSVTRVCALTGYAAERVRLIRKAAEIPAHGAGRPRIHRPVREEPVERDGTGLVTGLGGPWTPPAGYDLYAERPNQRRWLAMLAVASPGELRRLRAAVCRVLGQNVHASDQTLEIALIEDRRTADELAGLYIAAWESP